MNEQTYVSPYQVSVVYAALDDRDHASASLEKPYEARSWHMGALLVDPDLDGLRADSAIRGPRPSSRAANRRKMRGLLRQNDRKGFGSHHTYGWGERKRQFSAEQIHLALAVLSKKSWLTDPVV